MKFIILIFLTTFIPASYSSIFGGPYFATLEKVDNRLDMSKKYADWHLRITKKGRTQTMFAGTFTLKTTIKNPMAHFETYTLSNGQYKKMAVDYLVSEMPLCKDNNREKFFYTMFQGNVTWTDDCVLTPGTMAFKEGENLGVDVILHQMMPKCIYGRYKAVIWIVDDKDRVIGGAAYYVKVDKIK